MTLLMLIHSIAFMYRVILQMSLRLYKEKFNKHNVKLKCFDFIQTIGQYNSFHYQHLEITKDAI